MDDWLHPGATEGAAGVSISFRQSTQDGGATAAFDAADNLSVEIRSGGETLFSGSVDASADGGDLEVSVEVDNLSDDVAARISVALRRGVDELFTGEADATLIPGESTVATVALDPVIASLDLTAPPTFTVFGETADLAGRALFATDDEVPGTDVSWTSLDPQIVAVEPVSGGGWRAVALADGSASLQGTAGGTSATVAAEVRAQVTSVEVVPPSLDLELGEVSPLTALLQDAGGSTIPGRIPEWTSSDPAVASVSSSGVVTALAPGTTDVLATADGVSGRAAVQVRYPGPDVETLPATDVAGGSATLRARVGPNGSTTTVAFEYGADPDLHEPATTPSTLVSGSSGETEVTRGVSGLSPGSTYYVRAVATNGDGTTEGEVLSFTTAAVPAGPTSLAGSFTGGVLLTWIDKSTVETRFEIERELVAGQGVGSATVEGPARVFEAVATVGADVTQFEDTSPPAGELRYRVRACNDDGCSPWTSPLTWFYGLPPLVQTGPATAVGIEKATLSAFVNPLNAPTDVYWEVTFEPTFTTPPPMMFPVSPLYAGEGNVDVARGTIADFLSPGQTYYVRAIAINTWGYAVGNVLSFMTDEGG